MLHPLGYERTSVIQLFFTGSLNEPHAKFVEANVFNVIHLFFYFMTINGMVETPILQNVIGSKKLYNVIMNCFSEDISSQMVEFIAPANSNCFRFSSRLIDNYIESNLWNEVKLNSMFPNHPLLSMNDEQ